MTLSPSLSGFERQDQILEQIARNRRITVSEICQRLEVSEATARRDLDALARQGKLRRVHGGAISLQQAPPEQPMLQRKDEQAAEKVRIGQAVAGLIEDGETVFLGSGTTVLEVARALRGRRLTVLSNSLPVINLLASSAGLTLVCLGGILRESEFSFIGHLTEQALGEVRADRVVIGVRAIDMEQGLSNDYLPETLTDRAILKSGRQVLLVADHTKFGRSATALLAPIESVHVIVTDRRTPAGFVRAARARGLQVILA